MNEAEYPKIIYESQRQIDEMTERAYAGPLIVEMQDGTRYPLFIIKLVRINQEAPDSFDRGDPVYYEVGMVIVPEVTEDSISAAVKELHRDGYFNSLSPLSGE